MMSTGCTRDAFNDTDWRPAGYGQDVGAGVKAEVESLSHELRIIYLMLNKLIGANADSSGVLRAIR